MKKPTEEKILSIKSGHHTIDITHPDKVLFGKSEITKKNLIDYYSAIAPFMLPYLIKRPISMQRFPEGIQEEGFYQKDASDYFPSWITRAPIKKQNGETVKYVVVDKPAALIYLANQNCITIHSWLSKTDNIEKPDRLIFDLDPANDHSFEKVQLVAQYLKEILDALELPSFFMLTGSRGAHVVIPLKRIHTFDAVKECAHTIAQHLAEKYPKLCTVEMRKEKRGSRIFVDWLRNDAGSTSVAPYSVRPREGAPVAMPVTWQELQKKDTTSQKYTINNALKHIQKVGDIWKDMQKEAVSLKKLNR